MNTPKIKIATASKFGVYTHSYINILRHRYDSDILTDPTQPNKLKMKTATASEMLVYIYIFSQTYVSDIDI